MTKQLPVSDPHHVVETICDGRFFVTKVENLVTLTFTHERPDPSALAKNKVDFHSIVRARLVLTQVNAVALRDLLVSFLQMDAPATPASGGGTKH